MFFVKFFGVKLLPLHKKAQVRSSWLYKREEMALIKILCSRLPSLTLVDMQFPCVYDFLTFNCNMAFQMLSAIRR